MTPTLTTKSSVKDFEDHYADFGHMLYQSVPKYADFHHQLWAENRRNSLSYPQTLHIPDKDSLYQSFTSVMNLMATALHAVKDATEAVETLDADEDSEDFFHALGELFGAKTLYINMAQSVVPLEENRVRATRNGISSVVYFDMVFKNEGLVPADKMDPGGFRYNVPYRGKVSAQTPLVASGGWSMPSIQAPQIPSLRPFQGLQPQV